MNIQNKRELYFMNEAIREAQKGKGLTSPNPAVGAVIVHKNKIIGRGYHHKAGMPHAEIEALQSINFKVPPNSEIYVTLEPCSHYGKTPPCAEALIKYKFKKVFIGILDPNPLVNGRGKKMLEEAGIQIKTGLHEKKCGEINEDFFFAITNKTPFLTLKSAVTIDGKIASVTGDAKWISCEKSRIFAHFLRKINSAVMVGINTVLSDNPELNIRLYKCKEKETSKIIIVDPKLKVPVNSRLFTANKPEDIYILTDKKKLKSDKYKHLISNKINLLFLDCDKNGILNLRQGMQNLYNLGFISILVEGGGTLAFHLLRENLINKIHYIFAPKILGHGIQSVNGQLTNKISESIKIHNVSVKKIGCDFSYTGYMLFRN